MVIEQVTSRVKGFPYLELVLNGRHGFGNMPLTTLTKGIGAPFSSVIFAPCEKEGPVKSTERSTNARPILFGISGVGLHFQ